MCVHTGKKKNCNISNKNIRLDFFSVSSFPVIFLVKCVLVLCFDNVNVARLSIQSDCEIRFTNFYYLSSVEAVAKKWNLSGDKCSTNNNYFDLRRNPIRVKSVETQSSRAFRQRANRC